MRVGIDVAMVADVAHALDQFGDRYTNRLFTDHELASCPPGPTRAAGLAARFAAKEATLKVLRARSAPWHEIEVRRDPEGWVELALTGEAARLAAAAGIGELAVSLAHEGPIATAVVVGVGADPA